MIYKTSHERRLDKAYIVMNKVPYGVIQKWKKVKKIPKILEHFEYFFVLYKGKKVYKNFIKHF